MLGILLIVLSSLSLITPDQLIAFIVFTLLAAVAQFFAVETVERHSYYPHNVFLFASALLLSPLLYTALVITAHLAALVRIALQGQVTAANMYTRLFKIVILVVAGLCAHFLYFVLDNAGFNTASGGVTTLTLRSVIAATVAAVGYVIVNYHFTNMGVLIEKRLSWQESGLIASENLLADFVMVYMGYIVAVVWTINGWLIVPALSPLIVMYRLLLIPRLRQEAQIDSKTNLLNARYFGQRFEEALENARHLNQSLVLIMADLDLLRVVNNTYGHLGGDAVLAGVGKIICESIREGDFAGRFGGEEFAIVLTATDQESARTLAERMRMAIEATSFYVATSARPIRVTMSFGIACFPQDAETTIHLIHQADIAVYHAKLLGRNRVMCLADLPQAVRFEGIPPYDLELYPAPISMPLAASAERILVTQLNTEPFAASQFVSPQPVVSSIVAAESTNRREWFMGGVILVGITVAMWGLSMGLPFAWFTVGLLVLSAVGAELLQVDLYRSGTFSASVAISFAAALILGIPGVIFVSAAIAVTTAVAHARQKPLLSTLFKAAFNWATHVLAGAIPAVTMSVLDLSLEIPQLPLLTTVMAVAALVYFTVESGLIATAIGLSTNVPILQTWSIQFRWLAGQYLVLCIMGLFLSVAYVAFGWIGLLIFVLPILMMRYSQVQYIEQTEDNISELKRLNQELARANHEVISANGAIQQLNNELFRTLSQIIDARDPFVSCHATKVADYAMVVAQELRLPLNQMESLRQAALLHDIGKIAISENVLNKRGKLTQDEYEYVKRHAEIGAAFLETSHGLRHLATFIRHHHERWDGLGYPSRLQGEAIPFEARILAICDAVEVMASDRPYRRAWSLPEIIAELKRASGIQFDPKIAEIFVSILEREGDKLLVNSAYNVAPYPLRPGFGWLDETNEAGDVNSDITQIFSAPNIPVATQ